jgi:hypothetical protein
MPSLPDWNPFTIKLARFNPNLANLICCKRRGVACEGCIFLKNFDHCWGMAIRLIKHEAVPMCGSFEVRFPDGRPSKYFYWDDIPGRRLRPEIVPSEITLEQAKVVATAEHDRLSQ